MIGSTSTGTCIEDVALEKAFAEWRVLMLFGNKNEFALEIEINNFFDDDFIGEGIFNVHIKNKRYGLTDMYATTFLYIVDELSKFYSTRINGDFDFEKNTKEEIASCFYDQWFTENDLTAYSINLIDSTKSLVEWAPESAFDDGSHVIHIDRNNTTRIIGFKSCERNGTSMIEKNSIREANLSRDEFKKIILCAYNFLKKHGN